MSPIGSDFSLIYPHNSLPIMLDGRLMGYVELKLAPSLVKSLRAIKIMQTNTDDLYDCVPKTLEIAYLA